MGNGRCSRVRSRSRRVRERSGSPPPARTSWRGSTRRRRRLRRFRLATSRRRSLSDWARSGSPTPATEPCPASTPRRGGSWRGSGSVPPQRLSPSRIASSWLQPPPDLRRSRHTTELLLAHRKHVRTVCRVVREAAQARRHEHHVVGDDEWCDRSGPPHQIALEQSVGGDALPPAEARGVPHAPLEARVLEVAEVAVSGEELVDEVEGV